MNEEFNDQQPVNKEQPAASEKPAGYPLDWETTDVKLAKGRFTHTLRRPTLEQILARENDLQTEIPIGKDGSYKLPDPTAAEDVNAKLYDQIAAGAVGYEDGRIPVLHKSAAITGLYLREIDVDDDVNVFADEIPVLEEFGSGDEPDFVITHVMRQPTESELRKFRQRSSTGELKPGKRGKQKFVTTSDLKLMMQHYSMWLVRVEGATVGGQKFSDELRESFIANVDPLIQRNVVKALVEAVSSQLLD